MRSFSSERFKDVIKKGLRRFKPNPRSMLFMRNAPLELIECHNLVPAEKGLRLPTQIVDLNTVRLWGDTSAIGLITFPTYSDIVGPVVPVVFRDLWGDDDIWGPNSFWQEVP